MDGEKCEQTNAHGWVNHAKSKTWLTGVRAHAARDWAKAHNGRCQHIERQQSMTFASLTVSELRTPPMHLIGAVLANDRCSRSPSPTVATSLCRPATSERPCTLISQVLSQHFRCCPCRPPQCLVSSSHWATNAAQGTRASAQGQMPLAQQPECTTSA